MRRPDTWFVVLTAVCIGAPYLFGVRPRTRAHWLALSATIGFLAWMLLFVGSLRSAAAAAGGS